MPRCPRRPCCPRCSAWWRSRSSPWTRTASRGTGCWRRSGPTARSAWRKPAKRTRPGGRSPRISCNWPRPRIPCCAVPSSTSGCGGWPPSRTTSTRRCAGRSTGATRHWRCVSGRRWAGSGCCVGSAGRAVPSLNASWEITTVRQPLTDVESMMTRPGTGDDGPAGRPLHPLVVVGTVMLALYDKRDPDESLRLLAVHFESANPWTRSGARLMHAFSSMALGRLDDVARECAEALAGFEELGDRWGVALALVGQAELAALDGDHARAIDVLERAVKLSGELTDWEDTAQMHAS